MSRKNSPKFIAIIVGLEAPGAIGLEIVDFCHCLLVFLVNLSNRPHGFSTVNVFIIFFHCIKKIAFIQSTLLLYVLYLWDF